LTSEVSVFSTPRTANCNESWKNSGVSTYRWTPQGQKLWVSGHRRHKWIDAQLIKGLWMR